MNMYVKEKREIQHLNGGEVARRIVSGEVVYTTENDRNIGKTTLILKIADVLNKPVIVRENYQKKIYLEKVKELGLNVKILSIKEEGANIEVFYNDFLIDELSEREFNKLQSKGHTISGFILSDEK